LDVLVVATCVRAPFQVYLRWVTDSEKFNEWMNPLDYETEEAIEEAEAAAKADGKVGRPCWSSLSLHAALM
jgi:hypothetical protein